MPSSSWRVHGCADLCVSVANRRRCAGHGRRVNAPKLARGRAPSKTLQSILARLRARAVAQVPDAIAPRRPSVTLRSSPPYRCGPIRARAPCSLTLLLLLLLLLILWWRRRRGCPSWACLSWWPASASSPRPRPLTPHDVSPAAGRSRALGNCPAPQLQAPAGSARSPRGMRSGRYGRDARPRVCVGSVCVDRM